MRPCRLRLLLLIRIYLHKKDLCQDHHSSQVGPRYAWHKTLFAQRTRTWWASRRVALYHWERQTPLQTPSMTRNRTQSPPAPPVPGPLPGPVPPLSRQHGEEQDEPAQEVQTHGGPQLSPREGFAPCSSGFSLLGDLGLRHGRAKAKVEPCCASSDISP